MMANFDFWSLPDASKEAFNFCTQDRTLHIVWLYTRREKHMRPDEIATMRQFNPGFLGAAYRFMCSRWQTASGVLLTGPHVVQQLEKNYMHLCPACNERVSENILESSIEWMIGRGNWTTGDFVGFMKVDNEFRVER